MRHEGDGSRPHPLPPIAAARLRLPLFASLLSFLRRAHAALRIQPRLPQTPQRASAAVVSQARLRGTAALVAGNLYGGGEEGVINSQSYG